MTNNKNVFEFYNYTYKPIYAYATAVSEEVPLIAINEIRNSFDHLARAEIDDKHASDEYSKALDHLKRSVCDIAKLLYVKTMRDIDNLLENYELAANARILSKKEQLINEFNSIKQNNKDEFQSFQKWIKLWELIIDLRNELTIIDDAVLSKEEKKKTIFKYLLIGIIIGLFVSVIGLVLGGLV